MDADGFLGETGRRGEISTKDMNVTKFGLFLGVSWECAWRGVMGDDGEVGRRRL